MAQAPASAGTGIPAPTCTAKRTDYRLNFCLEDLKGKVFSQEESLKNTQMVSGMRTHSEKRGVVQHLKGSLIVNLEL